MKALNNDMDALLRKAIKKLIPDLQDREDFELKKVPYKCSVCNEMTAETWSYRFSPNEDWKIHNVQAECSECNIQRSLISNQEHMSNQMKNRLMDEYWQIPEDLKTAGFKNFKATHPILTYALNESMRYYRDFISQPDNRYSLMLIGSVGTGKSHLACAIARSLREQGYVAGFITTGRLLALIKETYHKSAAKTEKEVLKDISKLQVLILDDLGSESWGKEDEMSWTKAKLFEILQSRVGRPTIYTSNFNEQDLSKVVGKRVASRLQNNAKFIEMFHDDYRKQFRIK